jgi:type 1 fimbriae regulatory protein FimB/type 1 fimbriae regulatory protein FimE
VKRSKHAEIAAVQGLARVLAKMQRVGRKSDAELGRDGHKYLTPEQVEALIRAARQNRHGLRDALMISLAWHHGLRVSELIGLRWSDIDWRRADVAITRLKNGSLAGFDQL